MSRPFVYMSKIISAYTVTAVETEIPGATFIAENAGFLDVTFNLCVKTNGANDDAVIYIAKNDVIYNDYFVYVQGVDAGDELSANLTVDGIWVDATDTISLRCKSADKDING